MLFDLCVTNPPYNRGMDLDFINLACKLSTKICCINPAKWNSSPDDYSGCKSTTITYRDFRNTYTDRIETIIYYPDCLDIFPIGQVDGINILLIDKNKHDIKEIINKSIHQKHFNGITYRKLDNRQPLINIGNEIVEYLEPYKKFKPSDVYKLDKYKVCINTLICFYGTGRHSRSDYNSVGRLSNIFNKDGLCGYISTPTLLEEIPEGDNDCIFSSNNYNEAASFVSWLNTRFTRFFIAININKLNNIITDDYFRFVPEPPNGKFDHIFTD